MSDLNISLLFSKRYSFALILAVFSLVFLSKQLWNEFLVNNLYFGEIQTPYFSRFNLNFSIPSKTRHGIFDDSESDGSSNSMEFDDTNGLWPER